MFRYPTRSAGVLLAAAGLGLAAPGGAVAQVSSAEALVAETENFQIFCIRSERCAASTIPAPDRAAAAEGLAELQAARGWLEGMGFPVARENLDAGTDDKKALRLQVDGEAVGKSCGEMTVACFRLDPLNRGSLYMPVEHVSDAGDGETLVHEYVHALQAPRDPGGAEWINEAVATAIGSAWLRKRTGQTQVYEPLYSMVLDREFHDGQDDPGYGKWDYLIDLGHKIGSPDGVGWLAQGAVMDAAANPALRDGNGMSLFYDAGVTGGQTFDKFFPEYVARFNNVEEGPADPDRTGRFMYYGDIARHSLSVPYTDARHEERFEGSAVAFSAHPMLLSLDVTPTPERPEAENILVAEVTVKGGDAEGDLRLVREHRLAPEKLRDALLIDGNDAPDELGFFRIAYTPPPDSDGRASFGLNVVTRPVSFIPPVCIQAGVPARFELDGVGDLMPENWRLRVDNGTAEGAVVTPARAGTVNIEVEIDSPVTRRETGIDPVQPKRTRVDLGSFDVAGSDCMVRLSMGDAVLTYVVQGEYTEFAAATGEAIYFSETDMALWQGGGWMQVPPMAKGMIMGQMRQNNLALRMENSDAQDNEGIFFARMPLIFSQRFAWSNLKGAMAPGGGRPELKAAPCPDGGNGCRSTVFDMEGHPIPVVFDAQRRPATVTFDGEQLHFSYGSWPVRRPPGW